MKETKFKREERMYKFLEEVCFYSKDRIDAEYANADNYVSVDNLLPEKGGKTSSDSVPTSGTLFDYEVGDILLGNIRPYLKKIWFADKKGATNGDVLVIRISSSESIVPKFLYYVLSSDEFFEYNNQNTKGTKMPRGDKGAIMSYKLPVPPLAEQERIASALMAADNLIASLDKQIAKTRNLKQATMQHLLSSLPIHSPLKPLGEVCEFIRGQGMSKQDRGGGNVPIILYGELYTTYSNYINDVVSKASKDVVQGSPIVTKGDLLLPISSTTKEAQIGKVSAYCCDYDAYLGGDAILLRHKQVSGYMVHQMNSPWFERQKMPHAKGITINHLDPKGLSEIKIPIPAIEQQQRIADILLSMDNQIAALEAKRSKYEMVKQGMMQQLLTGTIRLI